MPVMISCNQNIGIAVIQGAYQKWFVSGQDADITEHETELVLEEPRYVYYELRTTAPIQLGLFDPVIVDEKVEFQQLAAKWRAERSSSSSITHIVLCPAYQTIIGMGTKAVPLILAQLQAEGDHPDHWFWALQTLTRHDPVVQEDEGDFRKMAKAWLDWAAGRYVW